MQSSASGLALSFIVIGTMSSGVTPALGQTEPTARTALSPVALSPMALAPVQLSARGQRASL